MQQDPTSDTERGNPGDAPEVTEWEVAPEDAGEESGGEAGLAAQVAEWKEAALRSAADLDNYRKRMARERVDLQRYANQSLLEELLPVLDNFEMGLQAAAQDEGSMIYQGMKMVKKQIDDFLAAQGVQEVPAEGMVFDPNVHEAVTQEESDAVECGVVLRVLRRGYRMKDRLLRPAIVVVAKAPEQGAGGGE